MGPQHAPDFFVITGLAHTAIHVTDVDVAVEWYHEKLGLTVLSPPYEMRGEEIARDMGELIPQPVVVKGAIMGVDESDRVLELVEYPSVKADVLPPPGITHLGYTHVALLCDDVRATRRTLESRGVQFEVTGIADVAGLRTTWFVDPWENVFIMIEKVRHPERPYYRQLP
jgi:catechol 2,3-dioxygenase-like lactoylglutathione lyase family enzyme